MCFIASLWKGLSLPVVWLSYDQRMDVQLSAAVAELPAVLAVDAAVVAAADWLVVPEWTALVAVCASAED